MPQDASHPSIILRWISPHFNGATAPRTHDACQAHNNRRRAMNRLVSPYVTESRSVFFAKPR